MTRSLKSDRGFTLVELLVVIGIIAVLMSVLLPVLGNARESANRIKCLSNVRQIGTAVIAYTNDNKGFFPVLARNSRSEAIRWQLDDASGNPNPGLTLAAGGKYDSAIATQGIGPYLGLKPSNVGMLRCPSDPTFESRVNGGAAYSFSYSINWAFDGSAFQADNPTYHIDPNAPSPRRKLNQVRNPAEKVLVIEEDERTLDDTHASICEWGPNSMGHTNFWGWNNRLAMRHDRIYSKKRDPYNNPPNQWMWNSAGKGNVAFCDGHAEYVPRSFVCVRAHAAGDIQDVNEPADIPMH